MLKKILITLIITFISTNNVFAQKILKMRCEPINPKTGTFNFTFDLQGSKVIQRNEYRIDFPILHSDTNISFVESNYPQNGKTPLLSFKIDRVSNKMTLIYYSLTDRESKIFKEKAKSVYSKTKNLVQSYLIALNDLNEVGEYYYKCK
jgi:hypothetical protein